MLEQLAKKDKYWRAVALNISKDRSLADDLVQEMYIKLSDVTKEINDYYVIITILNLFRAHKNEVKRDRYKNMPFDDFRITQEEIFEIDDEEQLFLDSLKWYEKELIEMSYSNSLRDIQKQLNINYQFTNRVLTKAKLKWQEIKK